MSGKLSVGETLSEAFSIYGARAGVLMPIAFWVFLAVAVVEGLARETPALLPLGLLIGLVAAMLYQGMVVAVVREHRAGREELSIPETARAALPVLGTLLGAGVLYGLGVAAGTFLLIVPGLVLLTQWAVIGPVIVVERAAVIDAFRRSRALVSGSGWPVFGAVVAATLIGVAGALVLGAIAEEIANGPLVQIVFFAIASTVTAPIGALVASVLYYRLLEIQARSPAGQRQPAQ